MLLAETGKPLIQHTWEQACKSTLADGVCIATDSEEIAAVARGFGADVVMTGKHPTGMDRVAEACSELGLHSNDPYDIGHSIINVQADEPEIDPETIDAVCIAMTSHDFIITAVTKCEYPEAETPGICVKVIVNNLSFAIDFTRDENERPHGIAKHIGIYGYNSNTLQRLSGLPQSSWEKYERLEQLRAIQNGYRFRAVWAEREKVQDGIDTQADYDAFVARHNEATDQP
jgi:3-deoxy-manno-octulosonate cytidylyltransferase (CMP-KDO synthetase)